MLTIAPAHAELTPEQQRLVNSITKTGHFTDEHKQTLKQVFEATRSTQTRADLKDEIAKVINGKLFLIVDEYLSSLPKALFIDALRSNDWLDLNVVVEKFREYQGSGLFPQRPTYGSGARKEKDFDDLVFDVGTAWNSNLSDQIQRAESFERLELVVAGHHTYPHHEFESMYQSFRTEESARAFTLLVFDRGYELFVQRLQEGVWSSFEETVLVARQLQNKCLLPFRADDFFDKEMELLLHQKVDALEEKIAQYWLRKIQADINSAENLEHLTKVAAALQAISMNKKFKKVVHAIASEASSALHVKGMTVFLHALKANHWPTEELAMKAFADGQASGLLPSSSGNEAEREQLQAVSDAIIAHWMKELVEQLKGATSLDELASATEDLAKLRCPEMHSMLEQALANTDTADNFMMTMSEKAITFFLQDLRANRWPSFDDAIASLRIYQSIGMFPSKRELSKEHRSLFDVLASAIFEKYSGISSEFHVILARVQDLLGAPRYQYDDALTLKRYALESGILKMAAQYVELMGEVVEGAFGDEHYFEENSSLIVNSFQHLVDTTSSSKELVALRSFVQNAELHEDYRGNLSGFGNYLDQKIAERRATARFEAYDAFMMKTRDAFDTRLARDLGSPLIHRDSVLKYYQIRHPAEWESDRRVVTDGSFACAIALEDITDNDSTFACVHHDEHAPVWFHTKKHDGCNCLCKMLKAQMGEGKFPLTCGNPHSPHELPLTEEDLFHEGFDGHDIRHWQLQTLAAYCASLNDGAPYKSCPGNFCGHPIFARDVDNKGFYECPSCEEEFCYNCESRSHVGMTCEQCTSAEWHDLNSNLRPCPWCSKAFAKDDNCNYVTCINPACGRAFNFVRGRFRERSAFRDCHNFNSKVNGNEQLPARRYLVPGERGYQPGAESDYPETDGDFVSFK